MEELSYVCIRTHLPPSLAPCLHIVSHVVLFASVVVKPVGNVIKLVLRKATDKTLGLHLCR